MSDPAPAPVACPPHYWLIEGQAKTQTWTCQRCGLEREAPVADDPDAAQPWKRKPAASELPAPEAGSG